MQKSYHVPLKWPCSSDSETPVIMRATLDTLQWSVSQHVCQCVACVLMCILPSFWTEIRFTCNGAEQHKHINGKQQTAQVWPNICSGYWGYGLNTGVLAVKCSFWLATRVCVCFSEWLMSIIVCVCKNHLIWANVHHIWNHKLSEHLQSFVYVSLSVTTVMRPVYLRGSSFTLNESIYPLFSFFKLLIFISQNRSYLSARHLRNSLHFCDDFFHQRDFFFSTLVSLFLSPAQKLFHKIPQFVSPSF